ncbi:MAG: hypothetical protein U0905_17130 [Pirellulales bacterium]
MRTALGIVLVLGFAVSLSTFCNGQMKGQLVRTSIVWNEAPINRDTDIVRWKNAWYVVCCELQEEFFSKAKLRILSSRDGDRWESVGELDRPWPKASYRYDPVFSVDSSGRLHVTALGIRSKSWWTDDGREWFESSEEILKDHEFSKGIWKNDAQIRYSHGSYDGNSSTVRFISNSSDTKSNVLYENTFDFIPDDAAMVADGDRLYCMMSRQANNPIPKNLMLGRQFQNGWIGISDKPYEAWHWRPLELPICVPNLIRLPDGRMIAAVGLSHKKDIITLCQFDPVKGALSEFLEIPTATENLIQASYHRQIAGLAYDSDYLWITYHATYEGKLAVHLAKVKLDSP